MVLDDLAVLVAGSVTGTLGVDLFAGRMPEAPDSLLALDLTGSGAPLYVANVPGVAYEIPIVQVVARDRDYDSAYARAHAAYNRLAPVHGLYVNGVYYENIWPQQSPFVMGYDAADRIHVGFSCRVVKGPDIA